MKCQPKLVALGAIAVAAIHPGPLLGQLSVRETTWRAGAGLSFSADTLVVTAPDDRVIARYPFHQRSDSLFLEGTAASDRPCGSTGVYRTRFRHGAQRLLLYAVNDQCAARTALLTRTSTYDFVAPASAAAHDWYQRDPADSIAGINLYQAYGLLRGRRSVPVIVAVIDNGVDITHEDLQGVIWTNPGEVPGNGIDDDHNGYVDDVHGWNFRGAPDGTVVPDEQAGATQVVARWRNRFEGVDTTGMTSADRADRAIYLRAREEFQANTGPGADSNSQKVLYNLSPVSSLAIGDDPADLSQRNYGSPRTKLSPNLTHGTHVAGIIGAERNNDIGTDGIADNVRIMPIVATTAGGDERDKDVANAILYAVDNGAKVINLSFSKLYSPDKDVVDQAIRYAEAKHVLIVHAAGNHGVNIDSVPHFPIATDKAGRKAANFITVGWSRSQFSRRMAHPLSNYSPTSVDIFAPGSDIFSALPGNGYGFKVATSMSAPMVTGVIALLYSHFPSLTSDQVKAIVLETAFRPDVMVNRPGTTIPVPFTSLSVSGGIVNAYSAVAKAIEETSGH